MRRQQALGRRCLSGSRAPSRHTPILHPTYVVALRPRVDGVNRVGVVAARRVLLVDDHPAFASSACALLASEGFHVVGVASTGEEAVAQFAALRPDLMLLDLRLPGMSGVDVAHAVSSGRHVADVILISSDADAAMDRDVQAAPVRGFLPKRDFTCAAIVPGVRRWSSLFAKVSLSTAPAGWPSANIRGLPPRFGQRCYDAITTAARPAPAVGCPRYRSSRSCVPNPLRQSPIEYHEQPITGASPPAHRGVDPCPSDAVVTLGQRQPRGITAPHTCGWIRRCR